MMPRNPVVERSCAVCGTAFAAGGGRHQRPKKQKFCSNRCSSSAQVKVSAHEVRQMSEVEAAWLAGLFDGEGSIIQLNRGEAQVNKGWRITITNTSIPLLDRVNEVTGVHTRIRQKMYSERHTQSHNWQAYARTAAEVLRQILPHLIVKRAKALQVLERYGIDPSP